MPARAQDAAELSPAERTAYAKGVREAATLVRERRFVEARLKLDALLAQRPREPQARFLTAVADAEEGRTEAAIAGFESLTRDYPELPEPWNNLGALYLGRGDYDSARMALQTAVVAAPDWAARAREPGRPLCGAGRGTSTSAPLRSTARAFPSRRSSGSSASCWRRPPSPAPLQATRRRRRRALRLPHLPTPPRPRPRPRQPSPEPVFQRRSPAHDSPHPRPRRHRRIPGAAGARRQPEGRVRHHRRQDRRRARPRGRAEDRRQLSRLRELEALRRDAVPPRDRRLHDPGRRLHAGLQAEADARHRSSTKPSSRARPAC